jgi:protein-disulfide isomerase
VRFVFRHYPLSFHAAARPAAAAASCAHEQERFWAVHDHLFETAELGLDAIRGFLGRQPGFDVAAWDACMEEGRGDRVVAEDLASAGRAQVDGTPHFFINGVRVSGAQPFEAFESIIAAELER